MLKMQVDVVVISADTAAFSNFDRHGPADNVTGGQVLRGWGIAFHKALAFRVGQVAAFAARSFGDQSARAVDAGRVELHELHILHRQAGAQHHAAAVARAGVGRSRGEIGPSISAGGQNDLFCSEPVDGAVVEVPSDNTAAGVIVVHDQIGGEILNKKLDLMLNRLLIERVQHCMAGAVGGGTCPLGNALAVIRRHAAEGALINLAVFGSAEGQTVVLELDDRGNRFAAHILDGVLIAEPIRTFNGVVHVPAPVVRPHIAERGGNTALRGHRVTSGRENLRYTSGL